MKEIILVLIFAIVAIVISNDVKAISGPFFNDYNYTKSKPKPFAGNIYTVRKAKGFPYRKTTIECERSSKNSFDCTKSDYGKIKY